MEPPVIPGRFNLLGAGSSYLNGNGYPLAFQLWDLIKGSITDAGKRGDIQTKLDGGANGIEHALDLLDDGGATDTPYRHLVTVALAELFMAKTPPLDIHSEFVRRIAQRADPGLKIFSLNYDPLIEWAAAHIRVRVVDGYLGAEHSYFDPAVFAERIGRIRGSYKAKQFDETVKPIHLLKLHGSLGWYECQTNGVRRCGFGTEPPAGTKRLMIPPQRRKAADTMNPPYSALWSAFRGCLAHNDTPINRLVCIGYDFLLKPTKRNSSASLSSMLRDFVGLGTQKAAVTVIDLSSVPFDVRPTVAAQIGRLAFEFNYWNPKYREFPILLMCEEAHAYIPRASESQFAGARKSMERIAKEGRKYGVGLAVVSQRPHEVSETVLAQCGTFICLRITNPNDQAYVRNLVPESEGDLVSVLAGLGRGEALVLGEAVPLPTRLQFDKPSPSPNSDDVDFYAKWIDGPTDLDVDAIVKRWRSQER